MLIEEVVELDRGQAPVHNLFVLDISKVTGGNVADKQDNDDIPDKESDKGKQDWIIYIY